MTLDEMYLETAVYVDESIHKNDEGAYTGESLLIVDKFKSAINYAYHKICKERFSLEYSEEVVLDENKEFAIAGLTETFYELIKITGNSRHRISWEFVPPEMVRCPGRDSGETVRVYYYYLPPELRGLEDEPVFPLGAVDHRVLCYWAAFTFLHMEGQWDTSASAQAERWLSFWNDGFGSIKQNRGEPDEIKNVLGW